MDQEKEITDVNVGGPGASNTSSNFDELPIFGKTQQKLENGTQKTTVQLAAEQENQKTPEQLALEEQAKQAEIEKNKGKTPEQIKVEKDAATQAEADRLTAEQEETAIQKIITKTGYTIEGEFESSIDGISEYINKVAETAKREAVEDYVSKVPIVKDLAEYLANGGNPQRFMQTMFPDTDFSEVKFEGEDDPQREVVVREHLISTGYTLEEARDLISDYKAGNLLGKMSDMALNKLQTSQGTAKEQLIINQQRESERQQKEVSDYWDNMKQIIAKTTNIVGIPMPEKDKDPFFKYMALAADNSGRSQAMIDKNPQDPTKRMQSDYLSYKLTTDPQFFTKVVSMQATSKRAGELDALLKDKGGDRLAGKTKAPTGDKQTLKNVVLYDTLD